MEYKKMADMYQLEEILNEHIEDAADVGMLMDKESNERKKELNEIKDSLKHAIQLRITKLVRDDLKW